MSEIEKRLAESLTADDLEIIPHLPYLLQDLWELGASYKDIIELIRKNIIKYKNFSVLDLACGKGAVAVMLAKNLGVTVKGIDLIPEFIDYAKSKAEEYGVDGFCSFEVKDINISVLNERDYDIVIFAAAFGVLGDYSKTLKLLARTVKEKGFVIIDDVISYDGTLAPTKKQWLKFFDENGLKLIAEKSVNENELISINRSNQDYIIQRAEELSIKYPEKRELFNDYVERQQEECQMLESDIVGVTFLLQRK
ncbi:MAG: class I SAM-dependent methyltransferase [Christensenellales bacterium]|jgi:ubiquinone/menaquinone biosynthesis C-methylase UbiE